MTLTEVWLGNIPLTYGRDCTPETPHKQSMDCALTIGRSYTDEDVGVCLTTRGIEEDTVSVEINFLSDSPDNRSPVVNGVTTSVAGLTVTFTADAIDPDSDSLSYFWNFDTDLYATQRREISPGDSTTPGDSLTFGNSFYTTEPGTTFSMIDSSVVEHTYPDSAPRAAWLRVSDRKGGEAPWVRIPLWGWAPDTLYVHPDSTLSSISAGVDSATSGQVVLVKALDPDSSYTGPENSEIDFRGKRIKLMGETPDVTIDLSDSTLRAFAFSDHEIGKSVVANLRFVGPSDFDGFGGIALIEQGSRPLFVNCSFEASGAFWGGAVHVETPSRTTFRRCIFRGNEAERGGGISTVAENRDSAPTDPVSKGGLVIDECTFVKNEATGTGDDDGGGAVYYLEKPGRSDLDSGPSHLTMVLSEVVQNSANNNGGGISFSSDRSPLFIGNTFADNEANLDLVDLGSGDAVFLAGADESALADSVEFWNTVIWDGISGDSTGLVVTAVAEDTSMVSLKYCLIHNSWGDASNGNILTQSGPKFADPKDHDSESEGDYSLLDFSPCIDSGRWIPGKTENDRYGYARYDDSNVVDVGGGLTTYVDIGAVERLADSGTSIQLNDIGAYQAVKHTNFPDIEFLCSLSGYNIGRYESGNDVFVYRTFLDFGTTQIPDDATIELVELTLRIYEGLSNVLEIRHMEAPGSSYTGGQACMQRFNSINGETTYHSDGGWNLAYDSTRTVVLGESANADLEDQLGDQGTSDGWFSVGLRLETESFDDSMEIFDVQKLRVAYDTTSTP